MPSATPIAIAPAGPDDVAEVRGLFAEYIGGLGVDLAFQDSAAELATLPGKYAGPAGTILLARDGRGRAVGSAALRPLPATGECEIKRLYVRPEARGRDLGRRLALAIVAAARDRGYRVARLDTLASMTAARSLYGSLGFEPTGPYYDNPLPGTLYLALDLSAAEVEPWRPDRNGQARP